jgi:hypothetical protein
MRQFSILAVFIVILAGFGLTDRVRRVIPDDADQAVQLIGESRLGSSLEGASGFNHSAKFTNTAEASKFLPVGLAYFLFAPAPWQFGHLRQNFAIPETVFWVGLYPFVFWGMLRGLRRNFQGSVLLLVPAAILTVFYALYAGNIGTLYRMRVQVWLMLSIFAGWGWEALREKQSRRDSARIPTPPIPPRAAA